MHESCDAKLVHNTSCDCTSQQEDHHKVGIGKTPCHFILIYSETLLIFLKKIEDAFDTVLHGMLTKPLDATFSTIFLLKMYDYWKQLVTSYPVWL